MALAWQPWRDNAQVRNAETPASFDVKTTANKQFMFNFAPETTK